MTSLPPPFVARLFTQANAIYLLLPFPLILALLLFPLLFLLLLLLCPHSSYVCSSLSPDLVLLSPSNPSAPSIAARLTTVLLHLHVFHALIYYSSCHSSAYLFL